MQEEAKYLLKVSATSEKPKARPLSLALRAPVGREQGEQWGGKIPTQKHNQISEKRVGFSLRTNPNSAQWPARLRVI